MSIDQVAGGPERSEVDLSSTVTKLNRIKAKSRARLANSDLTRAFLEAALALTGEVFVEGVGGAGETSPPTLAYLSRPRILSRARAEHPELVPTEAKFRDRWAGHQDFLEDFVSYALYARYRSVCKTLAGWSNELIASSSDFASAVHRSAYEGARLILEMPAYRLQLLTIASAAGDPDVSVAVKRMYDSLTTAWFELFGEIAASFGFTLRPGVSPRTFAIIVHAVVEGIGVRLLAGLDEPLVDDERHESVLGTAVLALFVSLIENGDGLTIEEAANLRLPKRSSQAGGAA